jgi:adenosine deaminase
MNMIYTDTIVPPELACRLQTMPKVELHVHLEGATDAATVWELARRNKVQLPVPTLEDWQSMYAFRDFNHFIEVYLLAVSCMQTPDDFAFMTEQFVHGQAQQNIRYCEVFLSATYMLDKLPLDELIDALAQGAQRGEELYGTRIRFIPDITREAPESGYRVLDFVLEGQKQGLFIGLGIGGKEIGFPLEPFSDVFAEARRYGLHVVAHAGETGGPQSIWSVLNALQVERIGHGVRALEDPQLVDHLRQTQIPLEVSPCSNYRLKVVPCDRPHPIRALMDQGVYVTVNSDDPAMFATDLTSEYVLLAAQKFSWDELWQLNLNTLEASFLLDEVKATYRAEWQAYAARD